jgi:hypothetical protein
MIEDRPLVQILFLNVYYKVGSPTITRHAVLSSSCMNWGLVKRGGGGFCTKLPLAAPSLKSSFPLSYSLQHLLKPYTAWPCEIQSPVIKATQTSFEPARPWHGMEVLDIDAATVASLQLFHENNDTSRILLISLYKVPAFPLLRCFYR